MIVIESTDAKFDETAVTDFLKKLNPLKIEVIYYPEEEAYPIFQPKFINASCSYCSSCFWWNLFNVK